MLDITCFITFILTATFWMYGVQAQEAPIETSHLGVKLIGLAARPGTDYDVEIMGAPQSIERIRKALDLLEEKSLLVLLHFKV